MKKWRIPTLISLSSSRVMSGVESYGLEQVRFTDSSCGVPGTITATPNGPPFKMCLIQGYCATGGSDFYRELNSDGIATLFEARAGLCVS